jgi:hypothetical protein
MNTLWDGFKTNKTNQHLSVTYIARMLLIESSVELVDYPAAQTRVLDMGKASSQ